MRLDMPSCVDNRWDMACLFQLNIRASSALEQDASYYKRLCKLLSPESMHQNFTHTCQKKLIREWDIWDIMYLRHLFYFTIINLDKFFLMIWYLLVRATMKGIILHSCFVLETTVWSILGQDLIWDSWNIVILSTVAGKMTYKVNFEPTWPMVRVKCNLGVTS